MLFGQDRNQIRTFYCAVWRKYNQAQPMEPLETMIASVIADHPEYHVLLDDTERAMTREYLPELGESNPFLHMGMHIAIQEQLSTNRPNGILQCYKRALTKLGDAHQLEHRIMECLAEMIWTAQREGTAPDEQSYLRCVREIAGED